MNLNNIIKKVNYNMISKKIALILGANGQDGSYMCELLLEKQYQVHGTIRRSSVITTERIDHIFHDIILHYMDVTDTMSVYNVIKNTEPDEIYNFCAQTHVRISADLENYTFQTNTIGVLNILQAVKLLGYEKKCKIYQASTSEEFGNQTEGSILLNEDSPKIPVSIYGISKLTAEHICRMYSEAYGMFIVSSILFNHESDRRGHNFVTKKIANYVNKQDFTRPLELGNLNAKRDWGYAKDYIEAIWLMIQQKEADNYVIATGETHSVREFVELAFKEINIKIEWVNSDIDEIGIDNKTKKILVKVNPRYYRDIDINCLIGDASKARNKLNWKPKTSFQELVRLMVKNKTI